MGADWAERCVDTGVISDRENRKVGQKRRLVSLGPIRAVIVLTYALIVIFSAMTTPAVAADTSPYVQFSVALLTGVLGFVGSWIGAQVALTNFKKQRAFDKQLEWY